MTDETEHLEGDHIKYIKKKPSDRSLFDSKEFQISWEQLQKLSDEQKELINVIAEHQAKIGNGTLHKLEENMYRTEMKFSDIENRMNNHIITATKHMSADEEAQNNFQNGQSY